MFHNLFSRLVVAVATAVVAEAAADADAGTAVVFQCCLIDWFKEQKLNNNFLNCKFFLFEKWNFFVVLRTYMFVINNVVFFFFFFVFFYHI